MKTSIACLLMVVLGCALDEAPAPGEVVGTRVYQSALAAGCRVDCPKCPPSKVCPLGQCPNRRREEPANRPKSLDCASSEAISGPRLAGGQSQRPETWRSDAILRRFRRDEPDD